MKYIADAEFRSKLSILCSDLHIDYNELDSRSQYELNKNNYAEISLCFALFSLTSYAENEKLNHIIAALHSWATFDELYSTPYLDHEAVVMLNEMCVYMDDEAIDRVYKKLSLD